MDVLILLLAFAVLAMPMVVLVLFHRIRRLEARLRLLESRKPGELSHPTRRIHAQEFHRREPAPEPLEAEPTPPDPLEVEPATAAVPAPEPAPAPMPAQPSQPEPGPLAPAQAVPPQPTKRPAHAPSQGGGIRWEQWLGVRGAALVGGLLLALAGVLLFKHALDRDWITPELRVLTGALVGLGALLASELLRRREYRFAPAATAGAGVVVLYATIWASHRLYDFLPTYGALPLMAAVTATCAWLSVRFRAQLVAMMGLIGGFATPILLSIHAEQPLGLFGYLLLLDLGLVGLGLRMRWPLLGLFGVLGTYGVLLIWLLLYGSGEFSPLFLGTLGASALLFTATAARKPASARREWFASQAGALLVPFAFTSYFATITDFGERLWPLATLMGFLALAASWVGSRQDAKWLVTGVASGSLAVCALWLARTVSAGGSMVEFAACTVGLSAVFVVAERLFGRSPMGETESRWAAPLGPAVAGVGFALMTVVAAALVDETSPWPWLGAALGQALLLHGQGRVPGAGPLRVTGAVCAGLTLGLHLSRAAFASAESAPGPTSTIVWIVASALVFLVLVLESSRRDAERELRWAWHAAGSFAAALFAFLPAHGPLLGASPLVAIGLAAALAASCFLPGLARGWSPWYLGALLIFVARHASWISSYLERQRGAVIPGHLFTLELCVLALLAAAPLLSARKLATTRLAWAGAALLLCLSLGNAQRLHGPDLGSQERWPAPAGLAAVALAVALAAKLVLAGDGSSRERALRWLLGAASLLASLAIARRVGPDTTLVTFSLAGLALAALWRALPAAGLKATALVSLLLGAAVLGVHVLLGFSGQEHFPSSTQLVINWTSYSSGLPALCALGAALLIGPREVARLTSFERQRGLLERPWCTSVLGVLAALLAFVWLNLQVYLHFETDDYLQLNLHSNPARDLTLSICWILYALGLLAAGMARRIAGLRQLSLAFLLLTLVKVFLHDLGDLTGLYRVGSLAGLAISLLFVSLVYQRFVFPRERESGGAHEA